MNKKTTLIGLLILLIQFATFAQLDCSYYYTISNDSLGTKHVLQASSDGKTIQMVPLNFLPSKDQLWFFEDLGDGNYRITNETNINKLYLRVSEGIRPRNGTRQALEKSIIPSMTVKNNDNNLIWTLKINNTNGSYTIQNKYYNTNRSFSGSQSSSTPTMWPTSSSDRKQIWRLTRMKRVPIKILQYNTHLFDKSLLANHENVIRIFGPGGWNNSSPFTLDEQTRMDSIIMKLRKSNADIITLNEVWDEINMNYFKEKLKDIYPYCEFGALITNKTGFLNPNGTDGMMTSGILILSKPNFKIISTFINRYSHDNTGNEHYANKCILGAQIQGPSGKFIVSLSHTYGLDENIDVFINTTITERDKINKAMPIIFVGDLNIHTSKYSIMDNKFKTVNAIDVWKYCNKRNEICTNKDGYNVNTSDNKLDQYFSPDRKTLSINDEIQTDRLDMMYCTQGIYPLTSKVLYGEYLYPKNNTQWDLSDHYPLYSEFYLP